MVMKELAKAYEPKVVEERWYRQWEADGSFHARVPSEDKSYSIVIPPPNITGVLHM
ncbi:MAG: class I tRNA ligase family protein, partial [Geobacteraceae bacterium]|nr:class I tRNA ligase family protein [Geobacteraceae bacterium]